jgi:hypothetical protein
VNVKVLWISIEGVAKQQATKRSARERQERSRDRRCHHSLLCAVRLINQQNEALKKISGHIPSLSYKHHPNNSSHPSYFPSLYLSHPTLPTPSSWHITPLSSPSAYSPTVPPLPPLPNLTSSISPASRHFQLGHFPTDLQTDLPLSQIAFAPHLSSPTPSQARPKRPPSFAPSSLSTSQRTKVLGLSAPAPTSLCPRSIQISQ